MPTIRRATLSDVDAMHALQMRAFAEEARLTGRLEIPPLQERPESIADHVRSEVALVAVDDGAVVGCVRGIREDQDCRVRALVVDPSRHGRGLGSALLRALEDEWRHARRIVLSTNTVMVGNVPFYERHGYRVDEVVEVLPGIRLAHLSKAVGRDG